MNTSSDECGCVDPLLLDAFVLKVRVSVAAVWKQRGLESLPTTGTCTLLSGGFSHTPTHCHRSVFHIRTPFKYAIKFNLQKIKIILMARKKLEKQNQNNTIISRAKHRESSCCLNRWKPLHLEFASGLKGGFRQIYSLGFCNFAPSPSSRKKKSEKQKQSCVWYCSALHEETCAHRGAHVCSPLGLCTSAYS